MQYRQITYKLRVQRGPGRPDLVSERPRNKKGEYTDDKKPKLVSFDEHCRVDVERLLRIGAIEEYTPPAVSEQAKSKSEAKSGETR